MTDPLDAMNRADHDNRHLVILAVCLFLLAIILAGGSGAWAGYIMGRIAAACAS